MTAPRAPGASHAGPSGGPLGAQPRKEDAVRRYLYLSLLPESLVASMLPPEEFGAYMATGTEGEPHGEVMFLSIKEGFQSDYFDLADLEKRCAPHPDGQPKRSLYLGIYRVLEHVPLEAIESLWLITCHGRALELKQGTVPQASAGRFHLYREACPVNLVIASTLGPVEFCQFITSPGKAIHVPRICFVELSLAGLADDPARGSAAKLPYHNPEHIRECLAELGVKPIKTVDRTPRQAVLYRCIKGGFFLGDRERILYFPFPSREELEGRYHAWWSCANDMELQAVL